MIMPTDEDFALVRADVFEADGQRHKLAASIRNGPDREGSGWFTDIDVIDMVLIVVYIVASPFMAIYLVRTRRRWVRILRGQLDATRLAEQARAGRTEKAEPPAVA